MTTTGTTKKKHTKRNAANVTSTKAFYPRKRKRNEKFPTHYRGI